MCHVNLVSEPFLARSEAGMLAVYGPRGRVRVSTETLERSGNAAQSN
jgi:hypothetical protein